MEDVLKKQALMKLQGGTPLNELSEDERMSVSPGVEASAVKPSEMQDALLPGGALTRGARIGVDLLQDTSPMAADLVGSMANPTSMPFKFMKHMGKNEPLTKPSNSAKLNAERIARNKTLEEAQQLKLDEAKFKRAQDQLVRDQAVADASAKMNEKREISRLLRDEQKKLNDEYAGVPADAVEAMGGFRQRISGQSGPVIHDKPRKR